MDDVPQGSLMPLVVILVLVFGVAARCDLAQAAVGGALGLAAVWLTFVLTDNDFANYTFTGVFVVGSWLAGRGIRSRQARADDFEAHVVRVEREREAKAREAVAEERARIARELHDVVAHSVSVMVVQAAGGRRRARGRPGAGARGRSRAIEASRPRRRSSRCAGCSALLRARGRRARARAAAEPAPRSTSSSRSVREAGLPVDAARRGRRRAAAARRRPVRLPDRAGGADERAQARRAGARARSRVRYGADAVELEVLDDGPGAPAAGDGGGHGLVGMRERVALYGGELERRRRPERRLRRARAPAARPSAR